MIADIIYILSIFIASLFYVRYMLKTKNVSLTAIPKKISKFKKKRKNDKVSNLDKTQKTILEKLESLDNENKNLKVALQLKPEEIKPEDKK